jgi:hypothetical protein
MGEQSVVSRGHTVPGDRVENHGENDVEDRWEPAEQRYGGGYDAHEGSDEDEQCDGDLKSSHRYVRRDGRTGVGPRRRGVDKS